jgi:manganese-dependent inorganic pyrophosphatase
MNETIYIVGHKNPDSDSVCSAIAYSNLKNKLNIKTEPIIQNEINNETKFILNKFNIEKPQIKNDATNKKIILVDHNEKSQTIENLNIDNLQEIIDHHKIGDIQTNNPIYFINKPYGCTSTIIYELFKENNIEPEDDIKGLMLSAILSDTVIFRSPTCTQKDKEIANKLANKLNLNIETYGKEMFDAKSNFDNKTTEEILSIDFKEFQTKKGIIGINQVELSDLNKILKDKEKYIQKMNEITQTKKYFGFIFIITDILQEGSEIIITGNTEKISKALNLNLTNTNNSTFAKGIMSRKKQIVPKLEKEFN